MTITDTPRTNPQPEEQRPPFHITSISFRLDRSDTATLGWDLNHPYIETFWLPAIGPTSTLLLRFLGRHVTADNYNSFDPAEIATCLGISTSTGRNSPVTKTIKRLAYFDLAVIDSADDDTNIRVTVPATVPGVPPRKQTGWPEYLRILHSRAVARQHLESGKAPSR